MQPIPEARSGVQQRMTRAQASRAAQELLQQANVAVTAAAATAGIDGPAAMDTDGSERGLEGTTPSDGHAEDDHMILLQVLTSIRKAQKHAFPVTTMIYHSQAPVCRGLSCQAVQGGEVEVEGGEDEDEDEEGIPYEDEDEEDMEEADLDGDQTMGLDRMHVHTVELGDATPGEEPSRSEASAAARNAGPASTSAEPASRAPFRQGTMSCRVVYQMQSRANAQLRRYALCLQQGVELVQCCKTCIQAAWQCVRASDPPDRELLRLQCASGDWPDLRAGRCSRRLGTACDLAAARPVGQPPPILRQRPPAAQQLHHLPGYPRGAACPAGRRCRRGYGCGDPPPAQTPLGGDPHPAVQQVIHLSAASSADGPRRTITRSHSLANLLWHPEGLF